jgi:MerR family transcriptional regulator, thiopeptide resistance regulator
MHYGGIAMGTRSWKVGEVAAVTGLTVRTLHHYDELGLLHPAERTTVGNHRLYSETDMRRLYRIVALRGLGIPLPEIKRTLDLQGDDPRRALRVQLERLDHQVLLAGKLRQRVSRILVALEAGEQPSIDDVIEAIEEMTSMDSYYTPDQLARLEQRRQALGPDGIARVERDWARAIREMEAERQAGTDPADPRVQAIAGRWRELIEQFTGGDDGIRDALGRMYEAEGAEKPSRGMVTGELASYVRKAINSAH